MNQVFAVPEFNKFVIFVSVIAVLCGLVFWRIRSNKPNHQSQQLLIPPGGVRIFIAKSIILSIAVGASSILLQYAEAIVDYENEQCEEINHRNKHQCHYDGYTSNDIGDQLSGFLLNQEVESGFVIGQELSHGHAPDGPWFWLYYVLGSLVILTGFNLAKRRYRLHMANLKHVEEDLRPVIRQLANDPRGVIEGRIQMPPPVESSKPTSREIRRSAVILFFCGLISVITMMSFFDLFYAIESGQVMSQEHNGEAVLLSAMALGFNISGHTAVKLLSANYPGESIAGYVVEHPSRAQSPASNIPTKATSAREVLEELANEMRATRVESEMLRVQLSETRIQVTSLESELERKTTELEAIQALTHDMERIIKQSEDSSNKNLSLMDSVLVGDSLFNGDKIDKQVVNDPKAIAKAAIEAYKAGRTDVKSAELDF
ncbi:MAG TPA: hypothetical protein HA354_00725 [Candidatus Poseidoniaceae archaeon]|nr:MAG TPA: hypothetical protein D7I07_00710 [Candidatus Poseidoniales archaeon]HII37003.1 hypothetical protein [Candidatus Poseidoniaceae archaeon]